MCSTKLLASFLLFILFFSYFCFFSPPFLLFIKAVIMLPFYNELEAGSVCISMEEEEEEAAQQMNID